MVEQPSITAALFVDFQNVFRNLEDINTRAPREFAGRPERWLSWFQAGKHQSIEDGAAEVPRRRILVRRVYVDDSFSPFRERFTHGAGFTIIDCPRLTGEGKNAADIRMVVDILDTLQHPTRFDEFIILSSDADFTPVLHRLRAYDRVSTIVSLKNVSAALKSSCDFAVSENQFVREALGLRSTSTGATETGAKKKVATTIVVAKSSAPRPPSEDAATQQKAPSAAPNVVSAPPPPEETELESLCKQLQVPLLSKEYFIRALEVWAIESHNGRTLSELQKLIRDTCAADGVAITRKHISAITFFLRRAEATRSTFDGVEQVAKAVCRGILQYAKANDVAISEEHNRALAALFGCETLGDAPSLGEAVPVQAEMASGAAQQTPESHAATAE